MKIKQEVIERINGRGDLKMNLRIALDTDRYTIWRWIKENREDGPLTTLKSIGIISKALSLSAEEIVTEECLQS